MTKQENKRRIKAEALNKIRKLYDPKTIHNFTYYEGEGTTGEQLSDEVRYIIDNMNKELLNNKA